MKAWRRSAGVSGKQLRQNGGVGQAEADQQPAGVLDEVSSR